MNGERATISLAKKLGLSGDAVFAVRHEPPGFAVLLGDYGDAVWQHHMLPPIDVVIAFFTERAQLTSEWGALTAAAEPDGAVWVCWPKRSSGAGTDLTEDVLRGELLPTGWVDNKVCAIDNMWAGLRFVQRVERRRPADRARRR